MCLLLSCLLNTNNPCCRHEMKLLSYGPLNLIIMSNRSSLSKLNPLTQNPDYE